jgi:hypothetical protein
MSHAETYRSESGDSSRFEIRSPEGEVLLAVERDHDLMRFRVGNRILPNTDAIALGRWLAEAEKHDHWEDEPGVWKAPG